MTVLEKGSIFSLMAAALMAMVALAGKADGAGLGNVPSAAHIEKVANRGDGNSIAPDGPTPQMDATGKGAVLCVWGIYETARFVGQQCFANEDNAFQEELDLSLQKIDHFIIANSSRPVTQADLDARRAQLTRQPDQSKAFCTGGDAVALYHLMHNKGAAAPRVNTDDSLSVPREPVMNPYL